MTALQEGTHKGLDTRTVADLLDADAQASGRSAAPYDPHDEIRPSTRTRGPQRRSASEVDTLLAPFFADALAGVADRLIAQRVGIDAQQVKRWRARRRIRGRRGRVPARMGTQFLIAGLLGDETVPVPHDVSPVQGAWRPPVYALRQPLRYDLFARVVRVLAAEMTSEEIALGIGIEERDVLAALVLGAERGAP